jgi:apolipoprotein D and lipocalin family protein
MKDNRPRLRWTALLASLGLAGCQSASLPELTTVERVDVPRFMGRWYVIASIPTFIERNAYNAVESYTLEESGRILTEFTFNAGGFDGPLKRYRPVGTVRDESGAVWGMQFIWPIQADYRIVYLDEAYTETIIAREKRDYVWIMARTPAISEEDYAAHLRRAHALGYDVEKIRKVPQQPEDSRDRW